MLFKQMKWTIRLPAGQKFDQLKWLIKNGICHPLIWYWQNTNKVWVWDQMLWNQSFEYLSFFYLLFWNLWNISYIIIITIVLTHDDSSTRVWMIFFMLAPAFWDYAITVITTNCQVRMWKLALNTLPISVQFCSLFACCIWYIAHCIGTLFFWKTDFLPVVRNDKKIEKDKFT